jgi:putative Holliday junction resolvase
MRRGRRLGIDAGAARVGVAQCDPEGILATPVETIHRTGLDDAAVAQRVAVLAAVAEAIEILVGRPLHLGGGTGEAVSRALNLAGAIGVATGLPVRLVDERLTTVQASGQLRQAGRRSRQQKDVIDQAAAVVLLQAALDAERSSGRPAGEPWSVDSGPAATERQAK